MLVFSFESTRKPMVLCAPFKVPASIEDYNISSLFFIIKIGIGVRYLGFIYFKSLVCNSIPSVFERFGFLFRGFV